jgi:hypothetical protein
MDKSAITKAFNKILFEFLDEVIAIVPDNADIKHTRLFLDMMRMANGSLILKLWYTNMSVPYAAQIERNDLSFFIDKEYQEEASYLPNASEVLQGIDKLRKPVREMSDVNKETSMKYIKKLSNLSVLYHEGIAR